MKRFSDAQIGRRRFLRGAALAGGATFVAAAGRGALTSDVPARAPCSGGSATGCESKGYRVTPHIDAYYRSARD